MLWEHEPLTIQITGLSLKRSLQYCQKNKSKVSYQVLRLNTQEGMLIFRKEIPLIFASSGFILTPFLESALQISEKKRKEN